MIRFELRALPWTIFLAIAALGASSADAGKSKKPGALGRPAGALDPTPEAPTPAPALGWPHAILTASAVDCARNPGPNEVIVARDFNFAGSCAVLTPGFYPFATNFLVGNDAISSIKVGSAVRARVFKDRVYRGAWTLYPAKTVSGGLGAFNDAISSLRVEPADRSPNCNDLRDGEIALFANGDFEGDCVVLPGDESYANPESMGMDNDSISSIHNNSARTLRTYWDFSFTKNSISVAPRTRIARLPQDGFMTDGIDDDISSIQMLP